MSLEKAEKAEVAGGRRRAPPKVGPDRRSNTSTDPRSGAENGAQRVDFGKKAEVPTETDDFALSNAVRAVFAPEPPNVSRACLIAALKAVAEGGEVDPIDGFAPDEIPDLPTLYKIMARNLDQTHPEIDWAVLHDRVQTARAVIADRNRALGSRKWKAREAALSKAKDAVAAHAHFKKFADVWKAVRDTLTNSELDLVSSREAKRDLRKHYKELRRQMH